MAGEGEDLPAGYPHVLFNMTQVRQMTCRGNICRRTSDDLIPKTEQAASLANTLKFGESDYL